MPFAINILRAFRFRHRSRGAQELPAGVYYVPDQLEERYALLAIDQGMAVRMAPPATVAVKEPEPEPSAVDPEPVPTPEPPLATKPARKRSRRRKGAPPENKLFDVAENK